MMKNSKKGKSLFQKMTSFSHMASHDEKFTWISSTSPLNERKGKVSGYLDRIFQWK